MKTSLLTAGALVPVLAIAFSARLCSQDNAKDVPRGKNELKEKHQVWLHCDVDWLFTPHEVGQDFKVIVFFHGDPIPAARIALNSAGSVVAETGTDFRGVARFFGVPPGHYEARVQGGLLAPGADVTVSAQGTERAALI